MLFFSLSNWHLRNIEREVPNCVIRWGKRLLIRISAGNGLIIMWEMRKRLKLKVRWTHRQSPTGIWRFCPGPVPAGMACLAGILAGIFVQLRVKNLPQLCPKYAPTMPCAPTMPRVCPNYTQCFASTMPQLCINIGPSSHIILSCIENHKFIINKTNGYEKHKNIKQCELWNDQWPRINKSILALQHLLNNIGFLNPHP